MRVRQTQHTGEEKRPQGQLQVTWTCNKWSSEQAGCFPRNGMLMVPNSKNGTFCPVKPVISPLSPHSSSILPSILSFWSSPACCISQASYHCLALSKTCCHGVKREKSNCKTGNQIPSTIYDLSYFFTPFDFVISRCLIYLRKERSDIK